MYIVANSSEGSQTAVFFNNKICRFVIAANDEEGWIEVVDTSNLNVIDETTGDIIESDTVKEDDLPTQWERIPTKRLYGKVEFTKLTK